MRTKIYNYENKWIPNTIRINLIKDQCNLSWKLYRKVGTFCVQRGLSQGRKKANAW